MVNTKFVVALERTPISQLTGMKMTGLVTCKVPDNIQWERLCVKVPCALTITDKDDGKNTLYTATLKFRTTEDMSVRKRYAYRLTLLGGGYKLLGTDKRPYPKVEVSEYHVENITENMLTDVTVTYVNTAPPPTILA